MNAEEHRKRRGKIKRKRYIKESMKQTNKVQEHSRLDRW